MKHILVISQYFYPENFRINDICKELVLRGYKVTVLTGIPNYPYGKFFNGYSWFKNRKEIYEGIEIIRLPIISRGKSSIRLFINYYSFLFAGLIWKTFTHLKADVVFSFEVSPIIQVKVGMKYAKRRHIRHIAYIQDLWPDNLEEVAGVHNKMVLNHYYKMANKIYNSTDVILATSPSFVDTIRDRVSDEVKPKVKYWPQYAEDCYLPLDKQASSIIPDNHKFKIIFTGNIGYAQGLDILPELINKVDDVFFIIVGDGRYKPQLVELTKGHEDMFMFVDPVAPNDISPLLANADAAFLSFKSSPLFKKTIPAKLQSYMKSGIAILAKADGESKRIIEEAQCGICAGLDSSIDDFVNDINKLKTLSLKELGNNGYKYYLSHFDKTKLIDELVTWIEE